MKVYYGYRNVSELKDPVLAIGIFDGIHIGHKRVIMRMLASKDGHDRVIMTFDPHPRNVLFPGKTLPRIMSLDHRIHIFKKMGVDAVLVVHFSESLADMSPEEFIEKVIAVTGSRKVYVGENFHFGHKKTGSVLSLKRIGRFFGIDVRAVPPVKKGGRIVSSTWVRGLIASGNIKEAEKLLRRPVSILGTVIRGDERGRKLGVPTANIDPHHEVIPPPGVYAVKADVNGRLYDGVLNIGFRPTFYGPRANKREEPHIEAHLFDFDGFLYGVPVEIFFIDRIRKEKTFGSVSDLLRQISLDMEKAKKLLAGERIIHKIKRYKYL